jgi:hypothetical protein
MSGCDGNGPLRSRGAQHAERKAGAALAAGLLVLTLAAAALAAKPQAGARFSGTTSATPISGFHAPVSFKVSRDGRSLTGFTFSSLGCFGSGGFRAGEDVYTQPFSVIKVGTVKVAANGTVAVAGVKFVYAYKGTPNRTTTTVSVSGRFASRSRISGSITFSQSNPTALPTTCGPAHASFTAKAH